MKANSALLSSLVPHAKTCFLVAEDLKLYETYLSQFKLYLRQLGLKKYISNEMKLRQESKREGICHVTPRLVHDTLWDKFKVASDISGTSHA